jgi:hypothetical protein
VWRRYSDFAWLHAEPSGRLPGLLLPPLPPKLGAWPSARAVLRDPQLALYLDELLTMTFTHEPPPPPPPPPWSPPRAAAAGAGPGAAPGAAPASGAGRGAAAVAADPPPQGTWPAAARARAAGFVAAMAEHCAVRGIKSALCCLNRIC